MTVEKAWAELQESFLHDEDDLDPEQFRRTAEGMVEALKDLLETALQEVKTRTTNDRILRSFK